jgi:hypothetical protein
MKIELKFKRVKLINDEENTHLGNRRETHTRKLKVKI